MLESKDKVHCWPRTKNSLLCIISILIVFFVLDLLKKEGEFQEKEKKENSRSRRRRRIPGEEVILVKMN